ncbi:MAG: hypothetical protein JSS09_05700 [Verrucomicrobia bacterium]|nr:hypothetical protein [Verrucomicrobiota bacterium]
MRILVLFFLFTLFSCQPSSLEEFQFEGASRVRLLLEDLKIIETREDLAWAEPLLKEHFEKIADIAIEARLFQQKNPGFEVQFLQIGQFLSQSLLEEITRIYALEGGKECIERAQREAMLRLDSKEKNLKKTGF